MNNVKPWSVKQFMEREKKPKLGLETRKVARDDEFIWNSQEHRNKFIN